MSARLRSFAAFLLVLGLLGPGFAPAQSTALVDFEIKDQFDNVHRDEDFQGQVLCVIGSDKGGAEYNPLWGQAIAEAMTGQAGLEAVRILSVADLRGVPWLLKGMVKGKFPKEPESWVLMDWKGVLAEAYQFVPDTSNILLFDGGGILIHQESGKDPEAGTIPDIIILMQGAAAALGQGG